MLDNNLCIICQSSKAKKYPLVRDPTAKGLETLNNATKICHNCRDVTYKDAIENVSHCLQSNVPIKTWHSDCYAQLHRQREIAKTSRCFSTVGRQWRGCCAGGGDGPQGQTFTRSQAVTIDWSLFIFCQKHENHAAVKQVQSKPKSAEILNNAQYDHVLIVRLSTVKDLIAAEGKYHLSCYTRFERNYKKKAAGVKSTPLSLLWLCDELMYAAKRGHIIKLKNIWERYEYLAKDSGCTIPASFISRRTTFKDKLQSLVGDKILFVQAHTISQ